MGHGHCMSVQSKGGHNEYVPDCLVVTINAYVTFLADGGFPEMLFLC